MKNTVKLKNSWSRYHVRDDVKRALRQDDAYDVANQLCLAFNRLQVCLKHEGIFLDYELFVYAQRLSRKVRKMAKTLGGTRFASGSSEDRKVFEDFAELIRSFG